MLFQHLRYFHIHWLSWLQIVFKWIFTVRILLVQHRCLLDITHWLFAAVTWEVEHATQEVGNYLKKSPLAVPLAHTSSEETVYPASASGNVMKSFIESHRFPSPVHDISTSRHATGSNKQGMNTAWFLNNMSAFLLGSQTASLDLRYPVMHVHRYDPSVFWHCSVYARQLVWHSLISEWYS